MQRLLLLGARCCLFKHFFFQAEDGIRGFCLSRGLGDVCERRGHVYVHVHVHVHVHAHVHVHVHVHGRLYTSYAADDPLCVDLGGRSIIKKKIKVTTI